MRNDDDGDGDGDGEVEGEGVKLRREKTAGIVSGVFAGKVSTW